MRKLNTLVLILALMISIKANSAVVIINQSGNSFSPSTINVNVGDVIRWVWSSSTHSTTSITVPNGATAWDGLLNSSNTLFEYTVSVAGNYTYHCTFHSGMSGSFNATVATSVEKNSLFNDFKIYPNPTSMVINLPLDLHGSLHLFDVIGNEIKQIQSVDLKMSDNANQLNVSDLANGIYFIAYIPDNTRKRVTWKFLKN